MPESFSIIDDMSNPRFKARVMSQVGALQGVWRIEAKKYRPRRTDRQNRYYWPCFVAPFAEYLLKQGNEFKDPQDAAHNILKHEFLLTVVKDKVTGRTFEHTRSTTELTTVEFNEYLDRCAAMLAEECGVVVPEPSIYYEPIESKVA